MAKKPVRRSRAKRARPSDPMAPIGDVAATVSKQIGVEPPKVVAEPQGDGDPTLPDTVSPTVPPTVIPTVAVAKDVGAAVEAGALAPTKDDQLINVLETVGNIEPTATLDGMAEVMERLALNPNVDVDKLERLFELQDRLVVRQQERHAESLYNTAFSAMQADMPEITEKGKIMAKNGKDVQSTYALNEDIQLVLRPVLAKHGFSLSYKTDEVADGRSLKITGFLRHIGGHTETSEFVSPPDDSGSKNKIQGLGSTRAYGRRYTAFDLLNITTRGEDDDGASTEIPEPPDGYEGWEMDMQSTVHEGMTVLAKAFNDSPEELRDYATKYKKTVWAKMRKDALEVTRKQKEQREPGQEG